MKKAIIWDDAPIRPKLKTYKDWSIFDWLREIDFPIMDYIDLPYQIRYLPLNLQILILINLKQIIKVRRFMK